MERILEAVKFLATPFDDNLNDQTRTEVFKADTPAILLSSLIENCNKSSFPNEIPEEEYPFCEDASPTWKFTCLILRVLKKLKIEIEETELHQTEQEKSIEVLSLQNQILVQKCIELVVGFGILPYLLPGVGVPQKIRKIAVNSKLFTWEDERAKDLEKFNRLCYVLQTFAILNSHPSLQALLFPKHAPDILAALLQICKSPLKKPDLVENSEETAESKSGLSMEEYQQVMLQRAELNQFLTSVMQFLPQGVLVNTLLILGSSPKPRWMNKSCYEIVYGIILSPEKQGLHAISNVILESMGHSNAWKVTKVVSNLLKDALRFEDPDGTQKDSRVANLADQAYNMLTFVQNSTSREAVPSENNQQLTIIGLVCGLTLLNINECSANENLWNHLFQPLRTLKEHNETELNYSKNYEAQSVTLEELQNCVTFAEKLLSTAPSIDFQFPLSNFQSIWPILFQIFTAFKKYFSKKVQDPSILEELESLLPHFSNMLTQLLEVVSSLDDHNNANTKNFLTNFLMRLILGSNELDVKRYNLEIVAEPVDNSIRIICRNCISEEEKDLFLEDIGTDCSILIQNVLKNERLRACRGKLFSQLMGNAENFQQTSKLSEPSSSNKKITETDKVLMQFDEQDHSAIEKFVHMQLLSELGKDEELLEGIGSIEDPQEMLTFLELILKKLLIELDASESTGVDYEFSQSVIFGLTILSAMCESKKGTVLSEKDLGDFKLDWKDMEKFIPYLKRVRESLNANLISQGIPTMAGDIVILIETKGAGLNPKEKIKVVSQFEAALKNVGSPMLPIKGHGLLELRKLLESKDEETLKNEKRILEIFIKEVKNDDSYVYLMAIQGLATLGLKFHKVVMPVLIQEYGQDFDEETRTKKMSAGMTREERAEFRMKIGEILVRIVQRLGNIAPTYRGPLTNVFFYCVRDDDPLVRASALSNLGELCHLLKFTLGHILTEVWFCVDALLKTEKHIEVRRAALHLIVLLLRGVEKELTPKDILEDRQIGQYLRDVRRLLKLTHETEQDTVAKIHCQLALTEIDLIVGKILLPSDTLKYKIRVLEP